MFDSSQYQLLDFGNGEKLERFGSVLVRRPSPAAQKIRPERQPWPPAIEFELSPSKGPSQKGVWIQSDSVPEPWSVCFQENQFLLKTTPFGHLGIFPEQSENWRWVAQHADRLAGKKALNLFAYTGGTTLALARAGCEVVHIDAARNVVNWARENARLSGLDDYPVRWIAEDAMKFVERELRRGSVYDIVVADPPSFGRGPKNETWKIQRDFAPLIQRLGQLLRDRGTAGIISCHTEEFGPTEIRSMCAESMNLSGGQGDAIEMKLCTSNRRCLPSGSCFRWIGN